MPDFLGGSSYIKSRGAGDAYLLPLELYWGDGVGCELQREGGLTNIGQFSDQYRSKYPLIFSAYRASIRGTSLRRDGVLAHPLLLSGFQKE